MSLTSEDLLAISRLLDVKLDARLKPIENRLKRIEAVSVMPPISAILFYKFLFVYKSF